MLATKVWVMIAGNKFPGIIVSGADQSTVALASGRRVFQSRADVISLRTTNPANGDVTSYLTISNENLRFCPPRFGLPYEGLDADEHGEVIPLPKLTDLVADSIATFQKARLAARQEPEVILA